MGPSSWIFVIILVLLGIILSSHDVDSFSTNRPDQKKPSSSNQVSNSQAETAEFGGADGNNFVGTGSISEHILSDVGNPTTKSTGRQGTTDNNLFSNLVGERTRKAGKSKKKTRWPIPAVDSTLLRFLAEQRKRTDHPTSAVVAGITFNATNATDTSIYEGGTRSQKNIQLQVGKSLVDIGIPTDSFRDDRTAPTNSTTDDDSTPTGAAAAKNGGGNERSLLTSRQLSDGKKERFFRDAEASRGTGRAESTTGQSIPQQPAATTDEKTSADDAELLDKKDVELSNVTAESTSSSSTTTTATTTAAMKPQESRSISPLGEYNANRIAQLLLQNRGRDKDAAWRAGVSIQSLVLARTARKRVRDFLKLRDYLLTTATVTDSPDSSTATKQQPPPPSSIDGMLDESQIKQQELGSSLRSIFNVQSLPTPTATVTTGLDYGLEDVIRVLIRMKLTARDIAAVLEHTPSLALMRPRRNHEDMREQEDAKESGGVDIVNDRKPDTFVPHRQHDSVPSQGGGGGETIEETTRRAFHDVLLNTLGLRKYDARKVLRDCPGLLTMRGSKRAQEVVILLKTLGISEKTISKDVNALPVLLSRSPSSIFRFVSFLSCEMVRMPIKNVGALLMRADCADLLNQVSPSVTWRMDEEEDHQAEDDGHGDHLTDASRKLISSALWGRASGGARSRRPKVDDVYRGMTSTARALRQEIGTQDLAKVVAAYPSVLLLNVEEQIMPVANYLMDDLGIWKDDLPKVLQLYPTLLGREISEMNKSVDYMKSLGISDESLSSIFRAFPALLTTSVEDQMMPVVKFLEEIGVANVGRFVSRLPPVLGYSIERELRPKWEYLSEVSMYPSFELSAFPAYFSYPLDRVIKTRFEYFKEVKKIPTSILPLDAILRFGNRDFAIQVAKDKDSGAAFDAYAKARMREKVNTRRPRKVRKTRRKGGSGSRSVDPSSSAATDASTGPASSSSSSSARPIPKSGPRPPSRGGHTRQDS